MPTPANPSASRSPATPKSGPAWRSTRTERASPQLVSTEPCACGRRTLPPPRRCAPSSHQHEPSAVERLGVARYRLPRNLRGTTVPRRWLKSKRPRSCKRLLLGQIRVRSMGRCAVALKVPRPARQRVHRGEGRPHARSHRALGPSFPVSMHLFIANRGGCFPAAIFLHAQLGRRRDNLSHKATTRHHTVGRWCVRRSRPGVQRPIRPLRFPNR
jgi:hypothetical protein